MYHNAGRALWLEHCSIALPHVCRILPGIAVHHAAVT